MKSERVALVGDSDVPSGHRDHTTVGDMWRAPGRGLIQKHLAAGVWKTDDNDFSIRLRWQKIEFFQVCDKRVGRLRQPLPTVIELFTGPWLVNTFSLLAPALGSQQKN